MTRFLHTMIRVTDPDATIAFFSLIGLNEVRRYDSEAGRFTLIFLAAPGQAGVAEVELTHTGHLPMAAPKLMAWAAISAISRIRSTMFMKRVRGCRRRAT